jgi:hypothetical protein
MCGGVWDDRTRIWPLYIIAPHSSHPRQPASLPF